MSILWYYMCIKKKKIKKERREIMNSVNIMKNMKILKKKKLSKNLMVIYS